MTRVGIEDAENVNHHQDSLGTRITALKQKGNQLLKENKPKAALKAYNSALEAAAEGHMDGQQLAVLHSNRASAYIRCAQYVKVILTSISKCGLVSAVNRILQKRPHT
jgi:hypothetical protein